MMSLHRRRGRTITIALQRRPRQRLTEYGLQAMMSGSSWSSSEVI